jgi:peroxiredoxin
MPDLQNLYAKMKSKRLSFEILGVSIDALGGEPVRKWVDRFGITFPILLDPRGTVKKIYRTTGVPETFVIDPNGVLVRKFIGPRKWDGPAMINYLNGILNASERSAS